MKQRRSVLFPDDLWLVICYMLQKRPLPWRKYQLIEEKFHLKSGIQVMVV